MDIVIYVLIGMAAFGLAFGFVTRKVQNSLNDMILKKPKLTRETVILLNMDDAKARRKVRAVIETMGVTRLEEVEGKWMATTPRSPKSPGEVLIASFRPEGSGTQVHFESRPAIPFAVSDGGKNQDNVDIFTDRLKG